MQSLYESMKSGNFTYHFFVTCSFSVKMSLKKSSKLSQTNVSKYFSISFSGLRLSDGTVGDVTAGTFLWISGEQLIRD